MLRPSPPLHFPSPSLEPCSSNHPPRVPARAGAPRRRVSSATHPPYSKSPCTTCSAALAAHFRSSECEGKREVSTSLGRLCKSTCRVEETSNNQPPYYQDACQRCYRFFGSKLLTPTQRNEPSSTWSNSSFHQALHYSMQQTLLFQGQELPVPCLVCAKGHSCYRCDSIVIDARPDQNLRYRL